MSTLRALLVAAAVLLAGCTGTLSGTPGSNGDGRPASSGSGTISFYVSDQPNAIDDFEHLNVTITSVGFQSIGDGDETETANENDTASAEDDEGEDGGWIERDVDERTVDLTELRGDNASLVDRFDVPEGSYGKVFVHVGEVNATLVDGERVNVKLPSEKLQITERFAVANGTEVDFVFDIAVHRAGKSGKYILSPVISESGTDVPVERVDDEGEEEGDRERDLEASFVGAVAQGGNATVQVTREGEPVENATVYGNDERVGTTGADGRLTFVAPGGESLEVAVEYGDAEAELEREFDADGEAGESEGEPATTATAT